jgi:hypothetical protein
VSLKIAIAIAALLVTVSIFAQEKPAAKQPQIRINYLNVCAPSEAEQKEMAAALESIPVKPTFEADFEVSRGRTTETQESPLDTDSAAASPEKPSISKWVRIRREFPSGPFSNAQYSFSTDGKDMMEMLVFRARDLGKSVLQVSVQDTVTAGTPESVLASNTPVDRIRIERNGKSSIVLARCGGGDQSKFEALFRAGSDILAKYRSALQVRQTVPGDLARVTAEGGTKKHSTPKTKPQGRVHRN